MPLSGHSVGNYPETSSYKTCQETFSHSQTQLAEPLWTDPDIKSRITVCKLTSTQKKTEKSASGEWTVERSTQILASEEKATTTTAKRMLHAAYIDYFHILPEPKMCSATPNLPFFIFLK